MDTPQMTSRIVLIADPRHDPADAGTHAGDPVLGVVGEHHAEAVGIGDGHDVTRRISGDAEHLPAHVAVLDDTALAWPNGLVAAQESIPAPVLKLDGPSAPVPTESPAMELGGGPAVLEHRVGEPRPRRGPDEVDLRTVVPDEVDRAEGGAVADQERIVRVHAADAECPRARIAIHVGAHEPDRRLAGQNDISAGPDVQTGSQIDRVAGHEARAGIGSPCRGLSRTDRDFQKQAEHQPDEDAGSLAPSPGHAGGLPSDACWTWLRKPIGSRTRRNTSRTPPVPVTVRSPKPSRRP